MLVIHSVTHVRISVNKSWVRTVFCMICWEIWRKKWVICSLGTFFISSHLLLFLLSFLPANPQICTLSLKPGKKNPNMHMTFYKSALCALKIQQFCCIAFICNQLEGFLINRSWRFSSLELSTRHEEVGLSWHFVSFHLRKEIGAAMNETQWGRMRWKSSKDAC